MSKKFNSKDAKRGVARKVISIIAAVLAVVIVAGVLVSYNIATGGFVQRKTVAAKTENYEVSSAMMTYYFNSIYQQYVSSASAYISYLGLDTSKDLKEQTLQDGSTWYDYFMSQTKESVNQTLVLCEAAKAEGFTVDGLDEEIDEAVSSMKSAASSYGVTFDYYLTAVYGTSVNEKVLRRCLELSEIAAHYSEHMIEQYNYDEADWDKYFEDNTSTFLKADWLTYSFSADAETLDSDATDEEKAAAEAKRDEAFEALKTYAEELKATADEEAFTAYVENYLRNVKYEGMDDEALEEDKIDIPSLVSNTKKTGNTGSAESDLNKWAFDTDRAAYDTYVDEDAENYKITVYMILPAENTEDLGYACQYRDAYHLKNFRYIPALISEDDNIDADGAKALAEEIMGKYNEDPTEDNFALLASDTKYGDGIYEGGLRENADKGAISTEVDEWLYDSDRKAGDCEMISVDGEGYYIVYYVADADIKWQLQADNYLKSNKYSEDYEAFAKAHPVTRYTRGLNMVTAVTLSSSSS